MLYATLSFHLVEEHPLIALHQRRNRHELRSLQTEKRPAQVPRITPGTGKTSVIEAAFPDLLTVAGDGDTTVADLVGEYTQTPEGRYVFVHGPLVRAMREGRALLLDDATLIPPSVLAVVYPAMDGRREIVVKANGGEIVTAHPGFYVIAGHNLLLTEPTAVFSQFSDLLAVVSLSGPWTMRGTHRERWRVWSCPWSDGCGRRRLGGSRSCWSTRRVSGSTRLRRSSGICRRRGARRRRCGRMGWSCCAGSGSCGRSGCRGIRRPGSRPAISAGGCLAIKPDGAGRGGPQQALSTR